MSQVSESRMLDMEAMSSLVDGELDELSAARAFDQWKADPQARVDWHAYHLIGDVLRSDDLASTARHDAAFLAVVRQRLAREAVVLAPMPEKASRERPFARRRSWAAPAAVAAGFVAVAGALVVIQMSSGRDVRQESLATAPTGAVVLAGASAPSGAIDSAIVLNGQLIRDVRLDEYLAAHKKIGGSSAPGGAAGYLRNAVAVDGPAR